MLVIDKTLPKGSQRVRFEKDWETSHLSSKKPVDMFSRKFLLENDFDTYAAQDFAAKIVDSKIKATNQNRIRSFAGTI